MENNNLTGRNNEPEQIDLIDLVMQLWRGKVIIIACVFIAILLAVGYLAVSKEKWTSTAIITQPDAGQLATYSNAMNVLYGGNAPRINELQSNMIGRFSSAFSALSETLGNQEKPEKLTIDASVKGQPLPLKVTYQAPTAEDAQKTLAKYIQQVDETISKEVNADLARSITTRTSDFEQSLEAQEKSPRSKKRCVSRR